MNVEKEVRFKIDKQKINEIIACTKPFKENVKTLDITFGFDGFNSLAKYGFICRIRQNSNKNVMEVKKRTPDGWLEQQIKLESILDGINYFKLIGMKPYMFINRMREVRTFLDLKIFIDQVDVLGDFVEIEYQDSSNAKENLEKFLNKMKIENNPQDLYGDIIKRELETNSEFEKKYNSQLNKILLGFEENSQNSN